METNNTTEPLKVNITQDVAILIDGNNIERSMQSLTKDSNTMLNFDNVIPKLLQGRGLSRLIYFREGVSISDKLAERLLSHYHGSVVPCHKSADIPLSIKATQIARKVDTIIILSGDSDYVELVRHLKGEGVRVEIAAVKATTAGILKDEADHFVALTVEDSFVMPNKRRTTRSSSTKSSSSRTSSSRSSTTRKKAGDKKESSSRSKASSSRSSSSGEKKSTSSRKSSSQKQESPSKSKSSSKDSGSKGRSPRSKADSGTKRSTSKKEAPVTQTKEAVAEQPAKRGLFGWLKKD